MPFGMGSEWDATPKARAGVERAHEQRRLSIKPHNVAQWAAQMTVLAEARQCDIRFEDNPDPVLSGLDSRVGVRCRRRGRFAFTDVCWEFFDESRVRETMDTLFRTLEL